MQTLKSVGLVVLGAVLGYFAHVPHPTGRFIMDTNGNVLDIKTGQFCIPIAAKQNGTDIPVCIDLYKHY